MLEKVKKEVINYLILGSLRTGSIKRTPGRLPRIPFTPAQLNALENSYKASNYLSAEEANKLAIELELTNTRVRI